METIACTQFKFSADTGEIAGYGATFGNVDTGDDKIVQGAFSKSLRDKTSLPMLFSHDPTKTIGVWKSLKQDDRGLAVKGRISDTADGRDVRTLAKDGAITGLSIGYWPTKSDYDKNGIRILTEIDLVEVSVVTFPMNELARISAVKSALGRGDQVTRKDLEFLLRDSGLSRRATKRLMDHGYAGLSKQNQTAEALNRLAATLEDI